MGFQQTRRRTEPAVDTAVDRLAQPMRGPGHARGNQFRQDRLRGQVEGGEATVQPAADVVTADKGADTGADKGIEAAAAVEAPDEYVDLGKDDKAAYLAQLFGTQPAQDTFSAREFDEDDQSKLAAIMMNEGGRNERRRMLGSAYDKSADGLNEKLAARKDPKDLAGALADPKLKLTERERAILEAAQAGTLNLADLDSDDEEKQDAAKDTLTQVGIDHQVKLYDEYSALKKRSMDGEKLSKEEKSRLSTLEKTSLYSSGDFDDARGLSSARFRGIYDEGQTRFEASRYARSRDHLEAWTKDGEKGDGGDVGVGNESSKDFAERHPEVKTGNFDAVADAETSYGTAQIMGHYADRGDLKKSDGTAYTLDELKDSGKRMSPDNTDIDLQVSYFRDVAGVQGHLGSAHDLAIQYNGPKAPKSYERGITSNQNEYLGANKRTQEGDYDMLPLDMQELLTQGAEQEA